MQDSRDESQPRSSFTWASVMKKSDDLRISFTNSLRGALPSSLSVRVVENSRNSLRVSSGSLSASPSTKPWTSAVTKGIARFVKATASESSIIPPNLVSRFTPSSCPKPEATLPVATTTSVAPAFTNSLTASLLFARTRMGVSGNASRKQAVALKHLSGSLYVIAIAVGFSTPAALMSAPDVPSPYTTRAPLLTPADMWSDLRANAT
mmetsp:Transcript_2149/g.3698  ORF Transcript_2149/g.3698 Transcript_2149/m.3698 type:complete len:207 (+) Transcript_2149:100-720(+)